MNKKPNPVPFSKETQVNRQKKLRTPGPKFSKTEKNQVINHDNNDYGSRKKREQQKLTFADKNKTKTPTRTKSGKSSSDGLQVIKRNFSIPDDEGASNDKKRKVEKDDQEDAASSGDDVQDFPESLSVEEDLKLKSELQVQFPQLFPVKSAKAVKVPPANSGAAETESAGDTHKKKLKEKKKKKKQEHQNQTQLPTEGAPVEDVQSKQKQKNKETKETQKTKETKETQKIKETKETQKIKETKETQKIKETKETQKIKENQKSKRTQNTKEEKTEVNQRAKQPPKKDAKTLAQEAKFQKLEKTLKEGQFRLLNETLYTTDSKAAQAMFKKDPELFQIYHQGFQSQVEKWPRSPVSTYIKFLRKQPTDLVVADFGCGQAEIAQNVRQKVHSFDLISANQHVVACDIRNVPLADETCDIGIFCLALMGTNYVDFIREMWRVLKYGGTLKIAEIKSRFHTLNPFKKMMYRLGFDLENEDTKTNDVIIFLTFTKSRTRLPKDDIEPYEKLCEIQFQLHPLGTKEDKATATAVAIKNFVRIFGSFDGLTAYLLNDHPFSSNPREVLYFSAHHGGVTFVCFATASEAAEFHLQILARFPKLQLQFVRKSERPSDLPNDVSSKSSAETVQTIPGLFYFPEFISSHEGANLTQQIDSKDWANHSIGRRTQHYGFRFDYTTKSVNPNQTPEWEPFLSPIVEKIHHKTTEVMRNSFSKLPPFDQITINEYQKGQGIATHVDTHSAFGPVIVSLSLLSATVMRFTDPERDSENTFDILLEPNSLLVMSDQARFKFLHAIPYRKTDSISGVIVPRSRRISLTLRSVAFSEKVCQCRFPLQCDSQLGKLEIPRIASSNSNLNTK